jgi:serine O-acetyltransferase
MAWDRFREDVRRYVLVKRVGGRIGTWHTLRTIWRHEPLWGIAAYRFGQWVDAKHRIFAIQIPLRIAYAVVEWLVEIVLGIHIHRGAKIGRGFYIGHYGSLWIGPVQMGEYCNVSHEVTIGIGGVGPNRGFPHIGDRVYIGPGAKVFGRISIGNDVAIGANSVVSRSLADRSVVVGNPARVVGFHGSAEVLGLEFGKADPVMPPSPSETDSQSP